jgi:hypothetical protein
MGKNTHPWIIPNVLLEMIDIISVHRRERVKACHADGGRGDEAV